MIQDFTNKPQPFEILRGSANVFNILETKMGEGVYTVHRDRPSLRRWDVE